MAKMESLEEFEVVTDITTRMALVALTIVCDSNELSPVFEGIKKSLIEDYKNDRKELIEALVPIYKEAAIALKKELDCN